MSQQDQVIVRFQVQPRAKRNQIYGVRDDGVFRIRLTAPPVGGRANRALINFLADVLEIPRSQIVIVSGEKNREKLVGFKTIEKNEILIRLASLIVQNHI